MKLKWTRFALQDLRHLYEYIAEQSPTAVSRMVLRIEKSTQHLKTKPEMGRAGRWEGTRELIIAGTPYIGVYLIQGNEIQVVSVIHGAMRWPDTFPS